MYLFMITMLLLIQMNLNAEEAKKWEKKKKKK